VQLDLALLLDLVLGSCLTPLSYHNPDCSLTKFPHLLVHLRATPTVPGTHTFLSMASLEPSCTSDHGLGGSVSLGLWNLTGNKVQTKIFRAD
jgi:hypothetical protein